MLRRLRDALFGQAAGRDRADAAPYLGSPAWEALRADLVTLGMPAEGIANIRGLVAIRMEHPAAMLHHGWPWRPEYEAPLLAHAPGLALNELHEVVAALTRKGLKKAGPYLLSLFDGPRDPARLSLLWSAGDALSRIHDKRTYPQVLRLCADPTLGQARQMMLGILARIRTDEAYAVLVGALSDDTVRGHAMEAIGRFGRVDAIPLLEECPVRPGYYEVKARATALRRLRRRASNPAG